MVSRERIMDLNYSVNRSFNGLIINALQICTQQCVFRAFPTSEIVGASTFDISPSLIESPTNCAIFVFEKLLEMNMDFSSSTWVAPQIASFAFSLAPLLRRGLGVIVEAKLETVIIPTYRQGRWSNIARDEGVVVLDDLGSAWAGAGDDNLEIVFDDLGSSPPARALDTEAIRKIRKGKFFPSGDVEGTCPVCLDDFQPKAEIVKTSCSHLFHESCIVSWLEQSDSCPLCRKVLLD